MTSPTRHLLIEVQDDGITSVEEPTIDDVQAWLHERATAPVTPVREIAERLENGEPSGLNIHASCSCADPDFVQMGFVQKCAKCERFKRPEFAPEIPRDPRLQPTGAFLESKEREFARLEAEALDEARTNGGPLVIAQGKCSGDAVVTIRTQEEYVARYGHPSAMLEPGGAVTSVPIYDATEEGRREGKMPVVIMGPKDGVGKLPSARIYELESWEAIPRLDALIAYLDEQATKGPK